MKNRPTLYIADFEFSFKESKHQVLVKDLLEKEQLLEVLIGTNQNFYIITDLGTLINLQYDTCLRTVTSVSVTTQIKDMVCFKIRKIHSLNCETLQVCMLIEHDCLCQLKI